VEPTKLNSGMDVLGEAECRRLIATETVGRLGVVVDGRPLIYPVNFVAAGDAVLVRTDEGTMLEASSSSSPTLSAQRSR
jgi:nitroimidazol reductase NimA-like FMN-containing flavoprotein (pyridoxamine 5'-phosphate oxidase superfamily)